MSDDKDYCLIFFNDTGERILLEKKLINKSIIFQCPNCLMVQDQLFHDTSRLRHRLRMSC